MRFSFANLTKTFKHLAIESIALGSAFFADMLLLDAAQENISVRYAFDLRIYYLSKNILYQIDSCLTRQNDYRHTYAAAYNFGVAASIIPAAQLLDLPSSTVGKVAAEAVIYSVSSLGRMLVETCSSEQTVQQHIAMHKGKLAFGVVGIPTSIVPQFGLATPAFYWPGELFDAWKKREANETFLKILASPKATIPLQVFWAEFIKVCVKFSGRVIPFPEFIIDFILGTTHRLVSDRIEFAPVLVQATTLNALTTDAEVSKPNDSNAKSTAQTTVAVNQSSQAESTLQIILTCRSAQLPSPQIHVKEKTVEISSVRVSEQHESVVSQIGLFNPRPLTAGQPCAARSLSRQSRAIVYRWAG